MRKKKRARKRIFFLLLLFVAAQSYLIYRQTSEIRELENAIAVSANPQETEEQEDTDRETTGEDQDETYQNETNQDETNQDETHQNDAERDVLKIVARQIAPSAEREAIKAQCVIARTSYWDAKRNQTAEPEGYDEEERRRLWGADFEKNEQLFAECVAETWGEVLLWEGDYIYAAYHAISAGETRDAAELYADVSLPYLKKISCERDKEASDYITTLVIDEEEWRETCGLEDITVEIRDASGYVLFVSDGTEQIAGETFRETMGWDSSCFTLTKKDGLYYVVIKGVGHGYGLSQYEANAMAEDGKNYREILEYFYGGAVIEKQE
jgi:stage II sporulation protein D